MWFYFAVLAAVANAVSLVAHRTHGATSRPVELAWWTQALTVPFSVVILLLTHHQLYTSHDFLLPGIASSALCSFGCVLLFSAYKYSDASVVCPLGNLIPVGLIISSYVMFRTIPSATGLAGIALVVFGVYYTSVSGKHSLTHPFTAIWRQRGSRAMIGCVILWSVTTNLDKIALRSASPAFYLVFSQVVTFILLSLYLMAQPKRYEGVVWHKWWKHMLVIAAFTTIALFFQMKALGLASSSYVLAVKRLDTLLTIYFAGLFLHEKHLLRRFKGSMVAVLGVVVIYLAR
jgi:drug/metabolite transporter (DMT)-like permease